MMQYGNYWGNWSTPFMGNFFGGLMSFIGVFLLPFVIWSIFWKGWALWRAAKNDSKPWFIALLVINTLGILDILYIFVFGKKKGSSRSK